MHLKVVFSPGRLAFSDPVRLYDERVLIRQTDNIDTAFTVGHWRGSGRLQALDKSEPWNDDSVYNARLGGRGWRTAPADGKQEIINRQPERDQDRAQCRLFLLSKRWQSNKAS